MAAALPPPGRSRLDRKSSGILASALVSVCRGGSCHFSNAGTQSAGHTSHLPYLIYPLSTQQGGHEDQSRKKDTDSGR